ncbi:MAG: M3 family oligoendopeptidase [bacterium]
MTTKEKTGAEEIIWDLSDLFLSETDPQIDLVFKQIQKDAQSFSTQYKDKVATLDALALKTAYEQYERIKKPLYKLCQYASLRTAIDSADDTLKAFDSKVDTFASEMSNVMLFFGLELSALSKDTQQALLDDPVLEDLRYALQRSFYLGQYDLSEKEEQLINIKDLTGADAMEKLYEQFTSDFSFDIEIKGEMKTLNGSQLRALRQDPDPDVRKRAMELFFSRYKSHGLVFSHLYNHLLKDHHLEGSLRGYKTPLAQRAEAQDLSESLINTLESVTTSSYHLVQRYYRLKSTLLNMPLTLSDIYAPLPQAMSQYSYEESKKIVLDSFEAFDQDFYQGAKLMFDQNRIHAPVLSAKRGGAFCSSSVPEVNPYVMLNFLGRARDVSTMAHELGHAIHDILASKQPLTYYHPILPLAETASVFSEMLVTDRLKKQETDPLAKCNLLCNQLEDCFATSHRQNMFYRFERYAHGEMAKGLLSSEQLCTAYKNELALMFGDTVAVPESYHWEWATIPHIFVSPFYVYAYNFGNLLVMALYQLWLERGDTFTSQIKAILAAGSSASPLEIARLAEVDLSQASFWKKSLAYIEHVLDDLEALIQANPDLCQR